MKYISMCFIFCLCLVTVNCNRPAAAPVPGSINAGDALAFRATADLQAAITVVKTWQQCSVNGFPATILVDGVQQNCDTSAGLFPASLKDDLNTAINAFNLLGAAGKSYHSGLNNDGKGLVDAINLAEQAHSSLLGHASTAVNPSSGTAAVVKAQLAAIKGGK